MGRFAGRYGGRGPRIGGVFLAAATAGMLASGGVASANTFTVTTTNDSNDTGCTPSLCSLRDAIVAADAAGGPSTITLPAGTYKLSIPSTGTDDPTTGDLDVNGAASVTLSGAGSGATVIDADNVDRAFAVQQGAGLTLSGLTIENGNPAANSSGFQDGGAIYSDGALAVSGDVVFRANNAFTGDYGGAIYSDSDPGSTLAVSGATFTDNTAYEGGAIYSNQPGTATIQDSAFSGNNGDDWGYGGAIYGDSGGINVDASSFAGNTAYEGGGIYWGNNTDVTVTHSTFTNNEAGDGYGGAIGDNSSSSMTLDSDRFVANTGYEGGALYLDSSGSAYTLDGDEFDGDTAQYGGAVGWERGTLSASGSSFIRNSAAGLDGGALYADSGGDLSLTNATIAGNTAGWGGGIYYNNSVPTSLTNDTIAYNTATAGDGQGGGIYDPGRATTGSGATGALNTIVADNKGGDCGSSLFDRSVDAGHNLDGDASCFAGDASTDMVGVNPLLAQPADNGGAVFTDRLEAGSPAIGAGDSNGCPSIDARGISRPQGGCDIGAYEAAPAGLLLGNDAASTATTNVPFSDTITVSGSGPAASSGTTVSDQLPAGETLFGANPSQGTCSSAGSPAKVTCQLGTIDAGNSATVTLVVAEANPGSVTNSATAGNDEGAEISASAITGVAAPAAPAAATGTGTTGTGTTTTTATATTVSAPRATTGRSSHLTRHGAMVSGRVSTGGQPTVYFFQYGSSRRLGNVTQMFRATKSRGVKAHITHLLAGHRYFFRLTAVNDMGIARGGLHKFHTKKASKKK